jgi:hypothetical protein
METAESYLDECEARNKPVVPFRMSQWSEMEPAEILTECKKRGWVETHVWIDGLKYIGWVKDVQATDG